VGSKYSKKLLQLSPVCPLPDSAKPEITAESLIKTKNGASSKKCNNQRKISKMGNQNDNNNNITTTTNIRSLYR